MTPAPTVPEALQASLDAASGHGRMALLLRHADRAETPPGEPGDQVGLLPAGEARARDLARKLLPFGGVTWTESSPLVRCMATARMLGHTVEPTSLLGSPGPFVLAPERAAEVFGTLGAEAVVRAQIAGHQWPFMRPLDEGARLLLRHARQRMDEQAGVGLLISHDAIVMPVVAWATGCRFDEGWLEPLEGVVLTLRRGGKLVVWWNGEADEVQL